MARHPGPRVTASVITSLDGHIDDASPDRLVLSGPDDLAAVDALRAQVDAIMVGARTVRRDRPRLLVRDEALRAGRRAAGRSASPRKVTITASGDLDPDNPFFAVPAPGAPPPLVFLLGGAEVPQLAGLAEGVPVPDDPRAVLAALAERGVEQLLVEGGTRLHGWFLAADAVDELRFAVAPFLVGEADAPRFVPPGRYPASVEDPWRLLGVEVLGQVAVLRYGRGA